MLEIVKSFIAKNGKYKTHPEHCVRGSILHWFSFVYQFNFNPLLPIVSSKIYWFLYELNSNNLIED